MNPDHERDEWLMAQVAVQQRGALEPLVRRHAGPLLTFIERMVGDAHRSEELLQDVFLAVWKNRRQYQFPRPFKAWLYAIAMNVCRTAFRGRRLTLVTFEEDTPAYAADASPADAVIATETSAFLTQALKHLPAQQRLVVVLRIWDGLAYAEIADLLDLTEGTVRTHMHHGLAKLRKFLAPLLCDPEQGS